MYYVQKIHIDKLLARQCTTNSTVVIMFKQPLCTHFYKAQCQQSTSNHCLNITLHISLFFLFSAYVLPGTFITLYFVLRSLCLLPVIRSTL